MACFSSTSAKSAEFHPEAVKVEPIGVSKPKVLAEECQARILWTFRARIDRGIERPWALLYRHSLTSLSQELIY